MILKKILIIALSALFLPLAVKAIPAYPNPMKVVQADGTTLTVLLRGDEHGSMTFTTDGIPLFYNGQTANYEYATLQAGRLQVVALSLIPKRNARPTKQTISEE